MVQEPVVKYSAPLRIVHWLIALLIIGLLIVGLYMTSLPKSDPNHALLYSLHKSFGVTVLALAVLRLAIRLSQAVPPLPEVIHRTERALAQAGHGGLYILMFLMPLSGYLMTNSFGMPVRWFGVELPRFIGVDKDRGHLLADIHTYAAYTLIALVTLHVLAVILHYARDRVNLLKRVI